MDLNPDSLIDRIGKALDRKSLIDIAGTLPMTQSRWVHAGHLDAHEIGLAISACSDALTRRLFQLAEAQHGPAPAAYAWVACGSQGRREQTVHTDQDNALILGDDLDNDKMQHFQQLARSVNEDLDACGLSLCRGGVMAGNPRWCQPLQVWKTYFHAWIHAPEKHSVMLAQNFLDLRTIHGDPSLLQRLQACVLPMARENARFIASLARESLRCLPPRWPGLNFFPRSGAGARSLDLKTSGLMPIIGLARLLALREGIEEQHSRDRLMQSAQAGTLSPDGAQRIVESWNLICRLRLRHLARCIDAGLPMSNVLRWGRLPREHRQALRQAFSNIRLLQQTIGRQFLSEMVQ